MRIDAVSEESGREYTYITKRKLGAGGLARVYLAQKLVDTSAGNDDEDRNVPQVAVKLTGGALKDRSLLAREAKILKLLAETGDEVTRRVVRIGADGELLERTGTDDNEVLIELEYLDGKTLREWLHEEWNALREGDPRERLLTAAQFTRQLTEALNELREASEKYELDIMHRDLKPENIMVTSDGLRLFDFNVSTEAAGVTMTPHVGTVSYWAPEIRIGDKYDQRADLWSLGVIFWELIHNDKSAVVGPEAIKDDFGVDFPTDDFEDVDEVAVGLVEQLFDRLLCHRSRRSDSPREIHDLLKTLESRLESLVRPMVTTEEVLEQFDLIELISELRPSGQNSVVADVDDKGALQDYMRSKTAVDDPLESYLVERIRAALDGHDEAPKLLMLSGNAGDGKSYLIDRLKRHHLADVDDFDERVEYIADATHALSPSETQQARLEDFFAVFADGKQPPKDLYLIAMNTGMVIKFFEAAQRRYERGESVSGDLGDLYRELQRQLGLRQDAEQRRFVDTVEVINLDLRSLVNRVAGASDEQVATFFARMIDKLDPGAEDGLLTPKMPRCEDCPAKPMCPVLFNLNALQRDEPRRALVKLVRRAALDPEVHLSPRNLWAFLYRIITGGLERYEVAERQQGDSLCDVVVKKYQAGREQRGWLLEGQFTEQLFAHRGLGGVWASLAELDPAYTSVPEIDRLQTRLSVNKELDTRRETIEDDLGGSGGTLAGLALVKLLHDLDDNFSVARREDAAVRRHVFFNREIFDAYYEYGPYDEFEDLLESYATFSADLRGLTTAQQGQLIELGELVQEAVVRSYGRMLGHDGQQKMLRVSQPNVRSSSMLLVETDDQTLQSYFGPKELIRRDLHIRVHLADGRDRLLEVFGYQPKILNLSIANHRLIVDQFLYEFLAHVRNGQQPSAHDLAQFQALRFIAQRLGNRLAKDAQKLHVLDGNSGELHTLSKNAFGDFQMESV